MANTETNSDVHFSTDNTNGYTPEQLARANAIMDGCEYTEESEGVDADAYKAACEVALEAVEDDGDLSIETEAGVPSPTDTGVDGGVDVDVTVHIGDVTVTGGVTLIRRDSDGEWSSWGSRDHWCCQELLDVVDDFPTLHVLDEVLAAAREAISADCALGEVLELAHLSNPIDTELATPALYVSASYGVRTVADHDGGVWVPSDDARAEIDAADDPDAAAIQMCEREPMRGRWHA